MGSVPLGGDDGKDWYLHNFLSKTDLTVNLLFSYKGITNNVLLENELWSSIQ